MVDLLEDWYMDYDGESFVLDPHKVRTEIERLRAALQRIIDEADSDDGLTAWDGSDIARDALGH